MYIKGREPIIDFKERSLIWTITSGEPIIYFKAPLLWVFRGDVPIIYFKAGSLFEFYSCNDPWNFSYLCG